ncbi:ABC transporter permease [Bacillus toyonensis]|uniref:ABC transporter permease n=1 Tax=Bacillus cereus group TaxID=86661 RepID=UPI0011A22F78|nr:MULTISPECIES: ABC transporter permease [Bacillus cereus group]MBJ7947043.1 ABC transporter permease [Bacillus cereus group sp. N24]MCU4769615.1 ABC transporter permease [Bacillus toyonensis]MCU5579587.1 ABC transporter permease [Bacillus toyonensis]UFH99057.1 ABC transporter permease [Bacillus toyonensis]UKS61592.1 ABC transporter permease [Bacillus toyonensis]
MKSIFSYLWNVNKKRYIVTFLLFVLIEAVLFSQMIVRKSDAAINRQEGIFGIIMVIFLFYVIYMFLQTMKSYSRLLTNPMLRLTAISGKQYVFSMLIFSYITMTIWYGICGVLFYVSYVLAFPTTSVYVEAKEIMQAGIMNNLIYAVSDLFDFLFVVLQILLVITLVKLLTKKKKAQNILIVIISLVVNITITLAITLLGKLAPAFQGLRRVEYRSESKSLFIEMFQENGFNIFNISFMVIVSALIIYVIAYIIDKKLEV